MTHAQFMAIWFMLLACVPTGSNPIAVVGSGVWFTVVLWERYGKEGES